MRAYLPLPLILICLGHFLVDFNICIWAVYKTMMHLDLGKAGLIVTCAVLLGETLQPFFGRLADKGHTRALLALGPIMATGAVFYPYVSSYVTYGAMFVVTCVGSAAFHPSAASTVGSIGKGNRSLYMAFFTASGMVGMAFSQILFVSVHSAFDGGTFVLALPALLLALGWHFARIQGNANEPTGEKRSWGAIISLLRQRDIRILWLMMLCNQIALWTTNFLLPDLLVSRGYENWVSLGGGHCAMALGAACAALPLGYLADRTTPRFALTISFACALFLYYPLLYVSPQSSVLLLIHLFVLGGMLGAGSPLGLAFGTFLLPNQRGLVSALLMGMVWLLSEGVFIALASFIAGACKTDGPATALAVMGVSLALGVVACFKLPNIGWSKGSEGAIPASASS